MKMLSLMVAFACFAINMMQADVRVVEIAQMQQSQPTMMADVVEAPIHLESR